MLCHSTITPRIYQVFLKFLNIYTLSVTPRRGNVPLWSMFATLISFWICLWSIAFSRTISWGSSRKILLGCKPNKCSAGLQLCYLGVLLHIKSISLEQAPVMSLFFLQNLFNNFHSYLTSANTAWFICSSQGVFSPHFQL